MLEPPRESPSMEAPSQLSGVLSSDIPIHNFEPFRLFPPVRFSDSTRSVIYCPMLLAGAGLLEQQSEIAWFDDPRSSRDGNWWARVVIMLRDSSDVSAGDLACSVFQNIEGRHSEGTRRSLGILEVAQEWGRRGNELQGIPFRGAVCLAIAIVSETTNAPPSWHLPDEAQETLIQAYLPADVVCQIFWLG